MAKIKNGQTVSPNILNSSTVLLHVIMQKGYALKVTFLGWCLRALASVKMIEMANQIKLGEVYCSQNYETSVLTLKKSKVR